MPPNPIASEAPSAVRAALTANQLSWGDYSPASSLASPGKVGALPADGMALL